MKKRMFKHYDYLKLGFLFLRIVGGRKFHLSRTSSAKSLAMKVAGFTPKCLDKKAHIQLCNQLSFWRLWLVFKKTATNRQFFDFR